MNLSYVIASRNDNYCGDSLKRLFRTCTRALGASSSEIILVDWGSPEPLSDALRLHERIRHVYVPPEITQSFPTPFYETLALNIGIRRSNSPWIARLDNDILVGERFIKWVGPFIKRWLEWKSKEPSCAMFSTRTELKEDYSISHIWGMDTEMWRQAHNDPKQFFKAAVGMILAQRDSWHLLRGYDERLLHRNHMEHNLMSRFLRHSGLFDLGKLLSYDFYHQYHPEVEGREINPMPEDSQLNSCPITLNDPRWGLWNDPRIKELS